MTEFLLYADNIQNQTPEQTRKFEATHTAYSDMLTDFSATMPEIAQRADKLTTAGAELVDAFGITPEFFEDRNRGLLFASLAGNVDTLEHSENLSHSEQSRRREFIADATFLLTKDFSEGHDDLKARHDAQRRQDTVELPDEKTEAIYDKYTDTEMTQDLLSMIEREGIFSDVLNKMGIQEDQAEEIILHVLSTGRGTEGVQFDWKAHGLEWHEVRDWADGLERRGKEIAKELQDPTAKLAVDAGGFVTRLGDKEHIFIPMGGAEVVLAQERGLKVADEWFARPERSLGTLKHEFVHTQRGERVAKNFGFSVEEMRAEYFSGDNGEYFDVKRFFMNIGVLGGKHIRDIFDENAESRRLGREHGIWDLIGETYGLDMLIKIAAVMPAPYVRYEKSEFVKGMLASLGSYDDVAESYGNALTDEEKSEAAMKVTKVLEWAKEKGKDIDTQLYWLEPAMKVLKYDAAPYRNESTTV